MIPPAEQTHELDRYYRKNVVGICGVEFLWGLGLPVVLESTFLQLFLKHIGASNLAIGLIPIFFFIGSSVFALFSSYFTSHLIFKRTAVIVLHLISASAFLMFGAALLAVGQAPYLLLVFFICYAIFSVCVGMTLPVWLNYLVKIFSERRSVSGLGFMMVAQNVAKLFSSLMLLRLVDRYAFSTSASALTFMMVGALFALGSLFFFLTKELAAAPPKGHPVRQPLASYLAANISHIWRNKNFLYFIAADCEFIVVVTVISFYANYATQYCQIHPAIAAGAFVACIYGGAILINITVGSLDLLSLRSKCLASKLFSLGAMLLLICFTSNPSFFAASFLLGASRGTRMIVFAPTVKKLSGLSDATSYFAVAPLFTLPLAVCMPFFVGQFLDRFTYWQATAYKSVFLTAAVIIVITFICVLKTDFNPSPFNSALLAAREVFDGSSDSR